MILRRSLVPERTARGRATVALVYRLGQLRRNAEAALRDATAAKEAVRLSAVRDLGSLGGAEGDARIVGALVERLTDDTSVEVRAAAALALADVGDRGALPPLVGAMSQGSERVAQMALVAIGELATPSDVECVEVIERHLDAEAPALRFQALLAFGALFPARVAPVAARAARDADASVRQLALRLAEQSCVAGTDFDASADAIELARCALDDEDARVRLAGALLLARAGDRAGAEAIVDAVRAPTGTHEPEDEEAAIRFSGVLGLRDAAPALAQRGFGWFASRRQPFAWQAKVALGRLGHERAIREILGDLRSSNRDKRAVAIVAAGDAKIAQARAVLEALRDRPEEADQDAVAAALAKLGDGQG